MLDLPVVDKTSRAAVLSRFVFNAGRVTSMLSVFKAGASDTMEVVPSNPAIDNCTSFFPTKSSRVCNPWGLLFAY